MPEHLKFLNPEAMGPPAAAFSHVVVATGGRTVYLSGQVALDQNGELVGPGDMRAQTEQVMKNIKAGLEAVGGDMSHVVKRNLYITDISKIQEVRDGGAGFFDDNQPPASTAVEVSKLFKEEFLIEVDVVAVLP
jgi:reactive intermediate/imine deaminase